ncbi:MAG TPA: hypothetical protein VHK91_11530, partial [Flavisolibacter sp.]|nr:hypothetical protein [Flavisolibacter sp.]
MKKLVVLCIGMACAGALQAQILRAFTPRYSNTSVRGNIVFVSNNSITSSGGVTTEAPPGGSSTNNGKACVNLDVDVPPAATTYIPYGASWKYLDDNTRPAGWETTGFADGTWASGNAELGYGDGDEATVISYGGVATNKYITALFRKSVTIPTPSSHVNFKLDIEYDDGFIVYVNGVEVGRG